MLTLSKGANLFLSAPWQIAQAWSKLEAAAADLRLPVLDIMEYLPTGPTEPLFISVG